MCSLSVHIVVLQELYHVYHDYWVPASGSIWRDNYVLNSVNRNVSRCFNAFLFLRPGAEKHCNY